MDRRDTSPQPRGLFVTHDTSLHGAARSLQTLLSNYAGSSFDLMAQRPIPGHLDLNGIRSRFGIRQGRCFEYFLPFDACYQYARNDFPQPILRSIYNCVLRNMHRIPVARTMRRGLYDFIHLNSLVLHPLISENHRFILHMRDVYDGSNPRALQNAQKAAGVIFIDEATRGPFLGVPLRNTITLNNPIDMTGVADLAGIVPSRPNLDVARHTIFSVIGVASERKGTDFIVRVFMKHPDKDARLLIVGGRERAALARCQAFSKSDTRIIFWGEEPTIEKIYAISDYILRGEAFPCIGRTIYEGLYAGCKVIIPGDPSNPPAMFERDRYADDMFFYRPRSENDLLGHFKKLTGKKVGARNPRSNVREYIERFHAFILSVIGTEGA